MQVESLLDQAICHHSDVVFLGSCFSCSCNDSTILALRMRLANDCYAPYAARKIMGEPGLNIAFLPKHAERRWHLEPSYDSQSFSC